MSAKRSLPPPSQSAKKPRFSLRGATEEPDRKKWLFPRAVFHNFLVEGPRDVRKVLETDVGNGDCLPACLAAALEAMHFGRIESCDYELAASKMRKDINEWIKKNWMKPCLFNTNMRYHELIALAHDAGISSAERAKLGPWPEDADGRMARYIQQEDRVYFCDAE